MSIGLNQQDCYPERALGLPADEVHVWCFDLSVQPEPPEGRPDPLSHDEQLRAQKYRFPRERRRFIARRRLLRRVLGRYAGVEPAELELRATSLGKPYLAGGSVDRGVTFSLSHSEELVAIAVARNRAVGVDVELPQQNLDCIAIARQFFAAEETARLTSLPPRERLDEFLKLWTAGEALLKATGHGLTIPFDTLTFVRQACEAWHARYSTVEREQQIDWNIRHFVTPSGAVAAVATVGSNWSVVQLDGVPNR